MTTTPTQAMQLAPPRADLAPVARSHGVSEDALRQYLLGGDVTTLVPAERASLIVALCRHIGIDPIERPFQIIRDGKGDDARDVIYATKACTSALCRERDIDRELVSTDINTVGAYQFATARAKATLRSTGRSEQADGVVPLVAEEWGDVQGKRRRTGRFVALGPDAMANALMKASTKAKRRAVLDLVGLGVPDESEVEGKGQRLAIDYETGEVIDAEVVAPAEPEGLDVDMLRGIDARVERLAAAMRVNKAAAFSAVLKRLEIVGVRAPADLDPEQAVKVVEALDEELETREGAAT